MPPRKMPLRPFRVDPMFAKQHVPFPTFDKQRAINAGRRAWFAKEELMKFPRQRRDWFLDKSKNQAFRRSLLPKLEKNEFKIVKGDWVEILAGKDTGKQGRVIEVFPPKRWLYVEGLNAHIEVMEAEGEKNAIIVEKPMHFDKVALVDPGDHLPCEVDYQYTEDGDEVRVSTRSGMVVPFPPDLTKVDLTPGPNDTKAADVEVRSYVPTGRTFKENALAACGVEPSKPHLYEKKTEHHNNEYLADHDTSV